MLRHCKVSSRGTMTIKGAMLALCVLAGISASTKAYSSSAYPWCREGDGLDCSYSSFEQCTQSVQGRGGSCIKFG